MGVQRASTLLVIFAISSSIHVSSKALKSDVHRPKSHQTSYTVQKIYHNPYRSYEDKLHVVEEESMKVPGEEDGPTEEGKNQHDPEVFKPKTPHHLDSPEIDHPHQPQIKDELDEYGSWENEKSKPSELELLQMLYPYLDDSPSMDTVDREDNDDWDDQNISNERLDVDDDKAEEPAAPQALPLVDQADKRAERRSDQDESASSANISSFYFIAVAVGCAVAGIVGIGLVGVCWYKLRKNIKAASTVDYPAYGVTGPAKDGSGSPGDRKLAQSAQMYHYQQQKQQMIASERNNGEMNREGSDVESEEENEEGDYTVFECPGLAPTGEMEVRNPMFNEDTPASTPVGRQN